MKSSTSNARQQFLVFGILSLGIIELTGILLLSRDTIAKPYVGIIPGPPAGFFRPFFGSISPLLTVTVVAAVGLVSLGFLQSRSLFEIYTPQKTRQGLIMAGIISILFGIEAILVDLFLIRFPADINVPPPYSVLFYPVMGFVVEVAFSAFPLALLLGILTPLVNLQKLNTTSLVWFCIVLVSLLEAVFQMGLSLSDHALSWAQVYVGLKVFLFNVVQLYLFRRYNFMTMYFFRLVYYLYWHIAWGYFRLELLF